MSLIWKAYLETGRLKKGDEVIVPANTFVATILSISACGLVPILVEPDPLTFQLDERLLDRAITRRTRALALDRRQRAGSWLPIPGQAHRLTGQRGRPQLLPREKSWGFGRRRRCDDQ